MVKPFGSRGSASDPTGAVYSAIFHNKLLENSKIGLENSWNFFHPKDSCTIN